mgnify:CR=1 FL=1
MCDRFAPFSSRSRSKRNPSHWRTGGSNAPPRGPLPNLYFHRWRKTSKGLLLRSCASCETIDPPIFFGAGCSIAGASFASCEGGALCYGIVLCTRTDQPSRSAEAFSLSFSEGTGHHCPAYSTEAGAWQCISVLCSRDDRQGRMRHHVVILPTIGKCTGLWLAHPLYISRRTRRGAGCCLMTHCRQVKGCVCVCCRCPP